MTAGKAGFVATLVLAMLALVSAFADPLPGVLVAALFLAVAMGIRRGQPWAPVTGIVLLAVPIFVAPMRLSGKWTQIGIAVAVSLGFIFVLIGTARQLRRQRPLRHASGGPWILVMAAWFLFWLCLRPYAMPTGSMEDTLLRGDLLLVDVASPHLGMKPKRGELTAFRYPVDPEQTFVKRIAGVPGDHIRLKDGRVQLNGAPAAEPYANHRADFKDTYRDNFPDSRPEFPLLPGAAAMLANHLRDGEIVVPAGQYFVLGDNRDSSLDSRYWGFISEADIVGRPVLIYGSNEMGARSIASTRWHRLLKRL